MPTTEEIRLLLAVQGEADVKRLTKEIETQEKALLKYGAALGGLNSVQAQQDVTILAETKHLADLNTQRAAAQKSIDGLGRSTGGLGRSALEASRGFQDFVAGFKSNGITGALQGVQNNIEGVARGFGLGTTAIAAFSLIGPGLVLLTPVIEALWKKLNPDPLLKFRDGVDKAKESLDKLEKKEFKIAIDYEAIEYLKGGIEKLEKARKALKEAEQAAHPDAKAVGAAIEAAFGGTEGQKQVLEDIERSQISRGYAESTAKGGAYAKLEEKRQAALAARRAAGIQDIDTPEINKEMAEVLGRIRQNARIERGLALEGAKANDPNGIRNLTNLLRQAGKHDVARTVEGAVETETGPLAHAAERLEEENAEWKAAKARKEAFARKREAAAKEDQRNKDQRVKEIAAGMAKSEGGAFAGNVDLTAEDVRKRMMKTFGAAIADKLSSDVFASLTADIDKRIEGVMGERTVDRAGALKFMRADFLEKQKAHMEAEAHRAAAPGLHDIAETKRLAKARAQKFGGGLEEPIEKAINLNQAAQIQGGGVSDEVLNRVLQQQAAQFLRGAHATDENGNLLNQAQRMQAAQAMVLEGRQKQTADMIRLQAETGSAMAAMVALDAQLAVGMQNAFARINAVEQRAMNIQRQIPNGQRPNTNRGG